MGTDFYTFFKEYFPKMKKSYGEVGVHCPFHDDQTPSMSINLETGLWKCFACGKAGDVYTFYQLMHNVDFKVAKEAINGKETKVIEEKVVETLHHNLLKAEKILKFLREERGINDTSIKRFKLGWDAERITIPIRDEVGNIVNIRRYSPRKKGKAKMISWGRGYGSLRLFPIENLSSDYILICEGEMDCILANQKGIPAITATGGAGSWKSSWNSYFTDKIVWICYDVDKAGRAGALNVARNLKPVAKEVKIINLPLTEKGSDITDYFTGHGYTKEDFLLLEKKTRPFEGEEKEEEKEDTAIYDVHLSQASHSNYYNKNIRIRTTVAGKDLAPYLVPKKVKLYCSTDASNCEVCGLGISGGEKVIVFNPREETVLQMVGVSESNVKSFIKRIAGIPSSCRAYKFEIVESMNLEEVMLIPEVDYSSEEQEYVLRRAFYIGHGLRTNRSYVMEGVTIPDPKTQYSVHLIWKATPTQDSISSFSMTLQLYEELKIFQAEKTKEKIKEKLYEIAEDLENNVTRIYDRKDLILAIDLVYHSLLSFYFQEKLIRKGWLELLVLGDTRTGKTETIKALIEHYRLGEFVTGENASFAGLVGGMQQNQKRWSVTWGKIPLNDRRLVVIDECSGLKEEEIALMSGIRSTGVAEITKIQTEKTNARTRLIWISNPRGARSLGTYSYAVQAIKELIGKPEDIARFDFVVSCASDEVDLRVINKIEREKVEHKYTSRLCKNLILWAWSREPKDIIFSEAAIRRILEWANRMSDYTSEIPLVEAAEQRIKIAKLSAALAARVFSTDENGEKVLVHPVHVDVVCEFLEYLYNKPSLAYKEFSKVRNWGKKISEEKREEIISFVNRYKEVANLFLQYDYVRRKDLEDMLNLDSEEVREIITFMSRNQLIRKTTGGYVKQPWFIKLLREVLK